MIPSHLISHEVDAFSVSFASLPILCFFDIMGFFARMSEFSSFNDQKVLRRHSRLFFRDLLL